MQGYVTLKTVGGRSARILSENATYGALVKTACDELHMEASTVRLLHNKSQVTARAESNEPCVPDGSEVIVIGVRTRVLSPRPNVASPKRTSPTTARVAPYSGNGPLVFPHSPDGLRGIAERMSTATKTVERYEYLSGHSTIREIRRLAASDPSHETLRRVFAQAQEVAPEFVTMVNDNKQVFLDVLNGAPPLVPLREVMAEVPGNADFAAVVQNLFGFDDDDAQQHSAAYTGEILPPDDTLEEDLIDGLEADLEDAMDAATPDIMMIASYHNRLAALYSRRDPVNYDLVSRHHKEACHRVFSAFPQMTSSPTAEDTIVIGVLESFGASIFNSALEFFVHALLRETAPAPLHVETVVHTALLYNRFLTVSLALQSSILQPEREQVPRATEFRSAEEDYKSLKEFAARSQTHIAVLCPMDWISGLMFILFLPTGEVRLETSYATIEQLNQAASQLLKPGATLRSTGNNLPTLRHIWKERGQELCRALWRPIAGHVDCLRHDGVDCAAVHFILPSIFRFHALPLNSMVDENGQLVTSYCAFSQSTSLDVFLNSISLKELPVQMTIVSYEVPPAWLSRNLKKLLAAEVSSEYRPGPSIVHIGPEGKRTCDFPVTLLVSEAPLSVLLDDRSQVGKKALFLPVMSSLNAHMGTANCPYELMRGFYLGLAQGMTLSRAARKGILECQRLYPDEPWNWGDFTVINYCGRLEGLAAHAASTREGIQEGRRNDAQRNAVRSSREFRYLSSHGVGPLFEHMLQALLLERPNSNGAVLDCLTRHLENNFLAWTNECREARDQGSAQEVADPTVTTSRQHGEMPSSPAEKH